MLTAGADIIKTDCHVKIDLILYSLIDLPIFLFPQEKVKFRNGVGFDVCASLPLFVQQVLFGKISQG